MILRFVHYFMNRQEKIQSTSPLKNAVLAHGLCAEKLSYRFTTISRMEQS